MLSNKLATKSTVAQVLGIYSRIRQPVATEVSRRSRLNGDHFELRTLAGPDHRDLSISERLQVVEKLIQENFEWVSETDANVDLQRAMDLINKRLSRL